MNFCGKCYTQTPIKKLEIDRHVVQHGVDYTIIIPSVKYPGLNK